MPKPSWASGAGEPSNTPREFNWHDQLAMLGKPWVPQLEAENAVRAERAGVADLVRRLEAQASDLAAFRALAEEAAVTELSSDPADYIALAGKLVALAPSARTEGTG